MIVDPSTVVITAYVAAWADEDIERQAWLAERLARHDNSDWGDLDHEEAGPARWRARGHRSRQEVSSRRDRCSRQGWEWYEQQQPGLGDRFVARRSRGDRIGLPLAQHGNARDPRRRWRRRRTQGRHLRVSICCAVPCHAPTARRHGRVPPASPPRFRKRSTSLIRANGCCWAAYTQTTA